MCTIASSFLLLAKFASLAAAATSRTMPWLNSTSTDPFTTATSACTGCTVSVDWDPSLISFPFDVSTTRSTMTATVTPIVIEYPDGSRVTVYSTVARPAPDATTFTDFTATPTFDLTWTTYGTTLTWPTTYRIITAVTVDLDTISRDTRLGTATCASLVTSVRLPTPTVVQNTVPTPLLDYLGALPTVSALFSGKDPKQCSISLLSTIPFPSSNPISVIITGSTLITTVASTSSAVHTSSASTSSTVSTSSASASSASTSSTVRTSVTPTSSTVLTRVTLASTTLGSSRSSSAVFTHTSVSVLIESASPSTTTVTTVPTTSLSGFPGTVSTSQSTGGLPPITSPEPQQLPSTSPEPSQNASSSTTLISISTAPVAQSQLSPQSNSPSQTSSGAGGKTSSAAPVQSSAASNPPLTQSLEVLSNSTMTLVPGSTEASTTTVGVSGYSASGLVYTGPVATGGAGRYAPCSRGWIEVWVMGIVVWCMWWI